MNINTAGTKGTLIWGSPTTQDKMLLKTRRLDIRINVPVFLPTFFQLTKDAPQ